MTRESTLGRLLAAQGRESLRAFRGVRVGRALWVVVGVAVTASAILLAAVLPLFVQRVINADVAATGEAFMAISLAFLAQSGLIYVSATLLGYVTAELFAPRRRLHLRGPRATIWRSLHRLGNATSITLVVGVTGTAIGIALFGEAMQADDSRDSPGELGAIQLGVLLFVLLIALSYDAVRVVAELLENLPALWRWLAALLFPWIAAMVWSSLLPVHEVVQDILNQWGSDADVLIEANDGVVAGSFLFVGILWATHFVASSQPARFRAAWRASRDGSSIS